MSSTNKFSRKKSERGNAIIEFALAWSVLWLLFSGVYQYGYSFYIYNRLMTAVSDAAQLGAKISYDTASPSAYTTKLQNMVMYGDETAGSSPIVPGLTTGNVNVNVTTDSKGIPHYVTVSIHNFTVNAIFGSVTLNTKPRTTVQYIGLVLCSTCS